MSAVSSFTTVYSSSFNYDAEFPPIQNLNLSRKRKNKYVEEKSTVNTYQGNQQFTIANRFSSTLNYFEDDDFICFEIQNETNDNIDDDNNTNYSTNNESCVAEIQQNFRSYVNNNTNESTDLKSASNYLLAQNIQMQENLTIKTYQYADLQNKELKLIATKILGCHLEEVCKNFPIRFTSREQLLNNKFIAPSLQAFYSIQIPSISVTNYLIRIASEINFSFETMVLAIMKVEQIYLNNVDTSTEINYQNIYRLLLTSLLCCGKYHDDEYYNNAMFAKVGGVSVQELNILEVEFLSLIQFDFYTQYETYSSWYYSLFDEKNHTDCNCPIELIPKIPQKIQLPKDNNILSSAQNKSQFFRVLVPIFRFKFNSDINFQQPFYIEKPTQSTSYLVRDVNNSLLNQLVIARNDMS